MAEYTTNRQEPDESLNQQQTHECDRCGHSWEYTGSDECPTCPSCGRKVQPSERLGEATQFDLVTLCGGRGDTPKFDTTVTIDTAEKSGEVTIWLGLEKKECEAIWERLLDEGHEYPADARERVLEGMDLGHALD